MREEKRAPVNVVVFCFVFFMFTLEMWCGTGGLIPALTPLISDINNRTAIIIKFQKGGSEIAAGKHHDPAQQRLFRAGVSACRGSAHFSPLAAMAGSNLCRSHVNYI